MFQEIFQEIQRFINHFPLKDSLIFNQQKIEIDENKFQPIISSEEIKKIVFVDGGQAEIFSTANFCLSQIRVFAQTFINNDKTDHFKHEFYLLTHLVNLENKMFCQSQIFCQDKNRLLIDEKDILILAEEFSSFGDERTAVSKVANLARRLAELSLAKKMAEIADFVVLDGTLETRFPVEEKMVLNLPINVSAIAKTSSLFTSSGNSPNFLLNKMGPKGCWQYFIFGKSYFVKLNPKSQHVFRFEGDFQVLSYLVKNSQDALFLGYPYGLIYTDRLARITNEEKKNLKVNFMVRQDHQEIMGYLNSLNAHEILDRMG